jgi:large subunit ribosomal protein L2
MGIKARKPTTPSQRQAKLEDFKELSPKNKKPEKSLTSPLKKRAGRNAKGRLTMKNRGGGHKRKYRIIDFKRDKENMIPIGLLTSLYLSMKMEREDTSLHRQNSI